MPRGFRGPRLRRGRVRPVTAAAAVVLLVVVGVVIGEIVDTVSKSTPAQNAENAASWSVATDAILVQSASLASLIGQVESNPSGLTRPTLDAALDALETEASAEEQAFAAIGIAPPNRSVDRLVAAALSARAQAATAFGLAASLATGPAHDVTGAVSACERAGTAMAASDQSVARLAVALRRVRGATVSAAVPWTTSAGSLDPRKCAALEAALGANRALAGLRRLAIVAVSLEPNPYRIEGLPTPTTTTATTTTTIAPGLRPTTTTTAPAAGPTGTSGAPAVTTTTLAHPTTTLVAPPPNTTQIPPPGSRSYILPTAGTVRVEVVVANVGNESIAPVVVSAQLLGPPGAPSPGRQVSVRRLDAGSAVYESLGPLPVKSLGKSFTLLVSASASGVRTASVRVQIEVG